MGKRGRASCSLVNCPLRDKVPFWLVRSFRFIHLDSFISVQVCKDGRTRVVETRGYPIGRGKWIALLCLKWRKAELGTAELVRAVLDLGTFHCSVMDRSTSMV